MQQSSTVLVDGMVWYSSSSSSFPTPCNTINMKFIFTTPPNNPHSTDIHALHRAQDRARPGPEEQGSGTRTGTREEWEIVVSQKVNLILVNWKVSMFSNWEASLSLVDNHHQSPTTSSPSPSSSSSGQSQYHPQLSRVGSVCLSVFLVLIPSLERAVHIFNFHINSDPVSGFWWGRYFCSRILSLLLRIIGLQAPLPLKTNTRHKHHKASVPSHRRRRRRRLRHSPTFSCVQSAHHPTNNNTRDPIHSSIHWPWRRGASCSSTACWWWWARNPNF